MGLDLKKIGRSVGLGVFVGIFVWILSGSDAALGIGVLCTYLEYKLDGNKQKP